MPNVFIASDNKRLSKLLAEAFEHWPGWKVTNNAAEAGLFLGEKGVECKGQPAFILDPALLPLPLSALKERLEGALAARESEGIKLGDAMLHPGLRRVTGPGNVSIELTEKETELLRVLVKSGASGLTREQLLEKAWNYAPDVDTRTLETHIHRLRAKLKPLPGLADSIITTPSGYAWRLDDR